MCSDIKWLMTDIKNKRNDDPQIKVSELFSQYMASENIFSNCSSSDYETIVRTILSVTASCALGGITSAASSIFMTAINFNLEAYEDFFSYVAWVSLQASYSGRLALRASAAWGI